MKDSKEEEEAAEIRLRRRLLGLGFWIQGFRCFPWTGVNFFLKDGLRLAPSTLQLLQNSSNLPMVWKPLYGIVSDSVYIRGEHRIPYIAIGAMLQSVSWLSVGFFPPSSISIASITILLLLGNLGASIVEVANDALVAEISKPTSSPGSGGELQSFVWMLGSTGGALGNLLGGMCISWATPQTMFIAFGLLLAVQFLASTAIRERSLKLPKPNTVSRSSIRMEGDKTSHSLCNLREQLSKLYMVLKRPSISYSIAWMAMSFAVVPILTGTMFYYQTQQLRLDSYILGLSKVFGQASLIAWSVCYNRWLKAVPARRLVSGLQAASAALILSDVLFVRRVYWKMGVPDGLYVAVVSGLLEVLPQFKLLPFSVLMAELCPVGCEGFVMALLMSAVALASIVSGYLGVALASVAGVSADDFVGLPLAIIIQAPCTLVPLIWTSWIPSAPIESGSAKDE